MKKKQSIIYIVLILIITIILLAKLFILPRLYGHDTIGHTSSIVILAKSINIHNLLGDNIYQSNIARFGYAKWLFYPKLPHLMGAYIYKLTNDIYLSMDIVYLITTFLSGVVMYMLANKIFKNKFISFITSIVYLTYPYHMTEIYIRDAFAENFMFLTIPLIFLGLINLKENNYKKFYIYFILGYVIGINSHIVSMVFCTIFVALYLIYYRKEFFHKDKIKALIISTVIVTLLTGPFLVPLIENKLLNIYSVYLNIDFTCRETILHNVLSISELYIQEARFDKIALYIPSIVLFLMIVSTLCYFIKNKTDNDKQKFIFLVMAISVLITFISSKIFWQYLPEFLLMIQFPWRLLTFFSVIISIYALTGFSWLIDKIKIITIIFLCIVSIFLITNAVNKVDAFGSDVYSMEEITHDFGELGYQLEYFPFIMVNDLIEISREEFFKKYPDVEKYADYIKDTTFSENYYVSAPYEVISENANIKTTIIKDDFPNLEFKVENTEGKTVIQMPRTYYLGYVLKDKNNNHIKLTMNNHGMLSASITEDGVYKLEYTKTTLERISIILRTITIIFIIFILIKWRIKRKT